MAGRGEDVLRRGGLRMSNNPSAERNALFGRDDELGALLRQLRSLEDHGIVTITGLPGVGRSALAATAVAELKATGTVALTVPLGGVKDPLGAPTPCCARLLLATGLSTSLPRRCGRAMQARRSWSCSKIPTRSGTGSAVRGSTGIPAALLATALRPTHVPGGSGSDRPPRSGRRSRRPISPALALFAARAAATAPSSTSPIHSCGRTSPTAVARRAACLVSSSSAACEWVRSRPP